MSKLKLHPLKPEGTVVPFHTTTLTFGLPDSLRDWVQDWVRALRSGEYTQGRCVLQHFGGNEACCCLGVAALISGVPKSRFISDDADEPSYIFNFDGSTSSLDIPLDWLVGKFGPLWGHILHAMFCQLMAFNDDQSRNDDGDVLGQKNSFDDIADLLEETFGLPNTRKSAVVRPEEQSLGMQRRALTEGEQAD